MNTDKSILFHEEQRFKTNLLLVLLVLGMLLPIGILFFSTVKEQISRIEFILSFIAVVTVEIPIFVFFYYTKLETIVTSEGLGYRWWPLQKKYRMLFKDDLSDIKLRKGPPLNYGLHWIPGYGMVHNVRGRTGFQITLKRGRRIYIGSERVNDLKAAVEKLMNKPIGEFRNEF